MFAVTSDPLSIEALARDVEGRVRHAGEGCGAVATFLGLVRATHQGRAVRHLVYEAYAPLAVRSFEMIRDEIADTWPQAAVAIVHRVGRLEIGDASIAIAAATAHRADAFAVCRYAIERVKQITPVWKHEYFDDGEAWVEGALADPDDADARARARAIACA